MLLPQSRSLVRANDLSRRIPALLMMMSTKCTLYI